LQMRSGFDSRRDPPLQTCFSEEEKILECTTMHDKAKLKQSCHLPGFRYDRNSQCCQVSETSPTPNSGRHIQPVRTI
jgi:hypothetical protein